MYVYPKFGLVNVIFFRLFGPGLGNILFPWANAIVIRNRYGHKLIEPTWLNLKIGSFLRSEKDLRTYGNLFNQDDDSISGLAKFYLLVTAKKIPETLPQQRHGQSKKIIVCKGMKNFFAGIIDLSDNWIVNKTCLSKSALKPVLGAH